MRLVRFVLPSAAAVAAAAVITGLAEGLSATETPAHAWAAAGYFTLLAFPIGLAIALVLRGFWHGWQLDRLATSLTTDTGGAPRLAAWVLYTAVAVWLLAAVAFNAIRLLLAMTRTPDVVALGATMIITTGGFLLLAGARPAVRALALGLDALDRRFHRRRGRPLFTPRRIAAGGAGFALLVLVLVWLISVQPRIGELDIGFTGYLLLYLVIAVAGHVAWAPTRRHRITATAAAAVPLLAAAAAAGFALWVRYQRPYTMLEIWGTVQLAGGAVDRIYDIESLRDEIDLPEMRPEERPGAAHPDIILITIDTVRADRTPVGGGTARMPALERLAGDGAVFDWAFAPGNVTRRSLPTIALGVDPRRVRGRVAGWALRLDPRHVTLAERLNAAGYETAGFFCCDSQFGKRHRLGLSRGIDAPEIESNGAELAAAAAAWLRQRDQQAPSRPLFLWMHFIEPHRWDLDYPQRHHGGSNQSRYDMALEAVDELLGTVLDVAWTDARKGRTVVVVTSDHGEGLGDHGTKFHSTSLNNSQIRVPLVIAGPGISARRVVRPVGLAILTPTLLDLAGYVPPGLPTFDEPSLAPLLRGEVRDRVEDGFAYSSMVRDRSVARSMRALVVGRHKLIEFDDGARFELYDLLRDRSERRDLARQESSRALLDQLKQRLEARKQLDGNPPF